MSLARSPASRRSARRSGWPQSRSCRCRDRRPEGGHLRHLGDLGRALPMRQALAEGLELLSGGLSRELGAGRTRVEGLGSCSGRSRRPPILKRFASESAERIAGNEMALDVECVLDCGMDGQEPLG